MYSKYKHSCQAIALDQTVFPLLFDPPGALARRLLIQILAKSITEHPIDSCRYTLATLHLS